MKNCEIQAKDASLWLINFNIKGEGKGTAIIKAHSPNTASMLLKNNGMYNGTSSKYEIYQIEELIPSPEEMLISEQVLINNE